MLVVGIQSILPQERTQLITKRLFAMMRLLPIDISQQRLKICRPNRERPVTDLPGETRNSLRLQPSRRGGLQSLDELRDRYFFSETNRKMDMIGNASYAVTFASSISCHRSEVREQIGADVILENGQSIFGAEDYMNHNKGKRSRHSADYRSVFQTSNPVTTQSRGVAPRWYRIARLALTFSLEIAVLAGCKSTPPNDPTTVRPGAMVDRPIAKSTYPPRPTTPPPPFKLFHTTDNSITLVTGANATDDQIAAILWQLHDAARTHTFDQLHISQKFVDARDPMIWFHIYRGPKCASEKYTPGTLPCGPSYHAAGDYTLGSFSNKNRDDAVLLHAGDKQTELWNPDAP